MVRPFLVRSHTHHSIGIKIESKKYAEAEQMVSGDGLWFAGFATGGKTENQKPFSADLSGFLTDSERSSSVAGPHESHERMLFIKKMNFKNVKLKEEKERKN